MIVRIIRGFVHWLFSSPKPKEPPTLQQTAQPGDGGVRIRALTFHDVSRELAERRGRAVG